MTTSKESTNKKKAITSTINLTLQAYPKVLTYSRTYIAILVLALIPSWTWSCRRFLLCMNLPIHDWLHSSLFDCCSFAKFFNPCLDELKFACYTTLGSQTSQQLLLCVCLSISLMTTIKYFFYMLKNPSAWIPTKPSHHGWK